MQAIAVVGPEEAGRPAVVDALVERLADRGRVGTVFCPDTGPEPALDRSTGTDQTYVVGEDHWMGGGVDYSLDDALGDLAVDCEYAVVSGGQSRRIPTIALGETDVSEPLLAAASADDLALDDAVAAIESAEPYETLESLVADVKRSSSADRAGAIATFTGRVRERDHPDDDPTEFLAFEKYDGVAEETMTTIRDDLESRDGVYAVRLHHRTGVVEAGEDIVFVVVLAGHRTEAFETVEDGINRLKDEVPLFKKEVTVSGEFWAHEH